MSKNNFSKILLRKSAFPFLYVKLYYGTFDVEIS